MCDARRTLGLRWAWRSVRWTRGAVRQAAAPRTPRLFGLLRRAAAARGSRSRALPRARRDREAAEARLRDHPGDRRAELRHVSAEPGRRIPDAANARRARAREARRERVAEGVCDHRRRESRPEGA